MSTGDGHCANRLGAQFVRNLAQLVFIEEPKVVRFFDRIQYWTFSSAVEHDWSWRLLQQSVRTDNGLTSTSQIVLRFQRLGYLLVPLMLMPAAVRIVHFSTR